MQWIAAALLARGFTALAAFSFTLWKTRSVTLGTAALVGSWLLVLTCIEIPIVRAVWGRSERRRAGGFAAVAALARVAGPFGIALVFSSLGQNIPRYVVEARLGHAELGVYSAAAYFFLIGARLTMAVADTILPSLSRLAISDAEGFRRVLSKAINPVVWWSALLVATAIPIAKPLLRIVYGNSYDRGAPTVVIVLVAAAFHCIGCIFQSALMALREVRCQVAVFGAGAVTAAFVSAALVRPLGGAGAAIGLAASLGIQAAALAWATFSRTSTTGARLKEASASGGPLSKT